MTELEERLLKQNEQLLKQVEILTEQVQLLTHKLYGRSSESSKKSPAVDENQISLFPDIQVFNEAEQLIDPNITEPTMEVFTVRRRKQKGQRALLTKDLETEVIECQLEGDQCLCEWCCSQLRVIGKEYVRSEVEFIPARLKKIEYYRHAYECPTCKADGADAIVKAPTPKPVIQKSLASPSTLSWLLHQKYEMGMPYYRQEKEWEDYGLALSRATLANWSIAAAQSWLTPVYDRLHRLLKEAPYLHADETTTQVLREPGRKAITNSYMWLFRTHAHAERAIVLFHYSPTRGGTEAKSFLGAYPGYLHCDAYGGYNGLKEATRCGCWAHVRRKFDEGIVATRGTGDRKSHCEVGRDYCNQLFKLERKWTELSPEVRHERRQLESVPLLNEFWAWVQDTPALKSTKLGAALNYALGQKEALMNFLQDGHCDISNNLAERSIRPFVVGRKNWYFSASVKGAKSSAVIYSMVETAKANGLDVQKYLTHLFKELPNVPFREKTELLDAYLPWAPHIQETCK